MLSEALVALAAAGGTAVVQAAASDGWVTAKAGFARLIGRDDPARVALVEKRLEDTRTHLTPLSGTPLEQARRAEATAWAIRLQDLLDEDLHAAVLLRQLVGQLTASGLLGTASAGDRGVAVGGDLVNLAADGGVAAGLIEGAVSTASPPPPPGPDQA